MLQAQYSIGDTPMLVLLSCWMKCIWLIYSNGTIQVVQYFRHNNDKVDQLMNILQLYSLLLQINNSISSICSIEVGHVAFLLALRVRAMF